MFERASGLYRRFVMRQAEKLGLDNRMRLARSINRRRYARQIAYRQSLLSSPQYPDYTAGVEALPLNDGWCTPGAAFSFAKHPVAADAKAILAEERDPTSLKGFMVNHLRKQDLSTYPSFIEAALHPVVLKTAADYLGMYPVLSSVKLLVSSPSNYDHLSASQLFHLDHADLPLLKMIINIGAVTKDSGPFCFLPASTSSAAKRALRYGKRGVNYRVDDETIYHIVDRSSLVELSGPPGDVALIDTSRCFHYGSRNASQERRILMYSFSTPARTDLRKPIDYSATVPCQSLLQEALLNPFLSD